MLKAKNKFIEAAEDKEAKKEEDTVPASAEHHNDIEEHQNALVDKTLEEAIWEQQREEMEADINKLIPTVNRQTTEAIGEFEITSAAKQDKPIEANARDAKQLQKLSHIEHAIVVERTRHAQRVQLFRRGQQMPNHRSDEESRATTKRGPLCQKKDAIFFTDNSNSGAVFSNLRHTDHVSTPLSILGRFSILTFTSSKSVRTVMHFDSSTIVQPFYHGSILLRKDSYFF
ncbi:hypothetical protein RFI_26691 [Reticulomyxa filosa]|uniref:Uncharacterized protein n=1 Tax=Reticulomyxa filosa TaxID=46433 RepID=X6MAJ0_RETFI|nr:hypothetical protein RFI_26691 [Reticulomyxa filosa]|eukprot:ETO10686.1 hypothetical protein RFI_26691 [Reticulomyxa filosa]